VLALETIRGVRVVADPAGIESIVVAAGGVVLRFAPDDAFVLLDMPGDKIEPVTADAIIAPESGFVGCWLTMAEVASRLVPHIEWPLPEARPALVQGLIAGVPAKLWLEPSRALLLCAAPYAHDLAERLA
jgi:hypothetical protein